LGGRSTSKKSYLNYNKLKNPDTKRREKARPLTGGREKYVIILSMWEDRKRGVISEKRTNGKLLLFLKRGEIFGEMVCGKKKAEKGRC